MSEAREQYLEAMGIQSWVRRAQQTEDEAKVPVHAGGTSDESCPIETPVSVDVSSQNEIAALGWSELEAHVADCSLCALHTGRTHSVFGVGARDADWMIIGEGPGSEEDRQGEPFVGRAGQLLNNMLRAIGLRREAVYIANIVKCRPPGNRDPKQEEAAACRPYLERQIALVRPRLILAVGRIAAQALLDSDVAVSKLRGQIHHYGDDRIPMIVTYHPAYLLRSPEQKVRAWTDLRFAQTFLGEAE